MSTIDIRILRVNVYRYLLTTAPVSSKISLPVEFRGDQPLGAHPLDAAFDHDRFRASCPG